MFEHLHGYWDTLDIRVYAGDLITAKLINTIMNHSYWTYATGQKLTLDDVQLVLHAIREYQEYKQLPISVTGWNTANGIVEYDYLWKIPSSWKLNPKSGLV